MLQQSSLRQQRVVHGSGPLPTRPGSRNPSRRTCLVTATAEQDQALDRRTTLSLLAGLATLVRTQPSNAAFGDAANVFGKATNTTGLIPFKGNGFSVSLPSRWSPSREREVPNVVLRYEDNGDAVNNVVIFKVKAGKGSVTDFGDPVNLINSLPDVFGQNVWQGATISEGGFKKDQVSAINLIDSSVDQRAGKPYYKLEVLTRTADGNEGGRHNLIAATVNGGDLWVCKVQIGDKRWFKGANKSGKAIYDTFTVA